MAAAVARINECPPAGHLRQAGDGFFTLLCHHHQVGYFVDEMTRREAA